MPNTHTESSGMYETSERVTAPLQSQADKLVEIAKAADPEHAEDARALLIGELGHLTDDAKSGAEDYLAADVLTITAFAVAVTSPELSKDSQIVYEDSGNEYYDVISVQSGYGSFPRMNVPVPLMNPKFIQGVREKLANSGTTLESTDREEHNRHFEDSPEAKMEAAVRVYKTIGDFAKAAQIERFVGVVYDAHTEEGKQKIKALVTLIRQCREAAGKEGGVEELAKKRMDAVDTLYGEDWEDSDFQALESNE